MVNPLDPSVNEKFQEAWRLTAGVDLASMLARQSLNAMAVEIKGDWRPPGSTLTAHMVDAIDGHRLIDPWSASRVLASLHNAAARLLAAARRRVDAQARISAEDRAAVNIGVAAAFGGSLTVKIVGLDVAEDDGGLFPQGASSSLDTAMTEFVSLFSDGELSEDRLVDEVMTSTPVLRQAVRDLVENEAADHIDITLTLDRADGARVRGGITHAQASSLKEALSEPEESSVREIRRGRLDGYRTSRKVFYFIAEDGSEIEGVIDDDSNLVNVQQYADRDVEVELAVITTRPRGGGRAVKHYRLISIGVTEASEE